MFNNFIVGQKYKVLVRPRNYMYEDCVKEKIEEIEFIGEVVVSGHKNLPLNNTVGYMFKTMRGNIIFTESSKYTRLYTNKNVYITIYKGYSDNNEYEFIE